MAAICSIHGLPNNQWGYCSGCERDPNISIRKCSRCGRPYAIKSTAAIPVCGDCAKDALIDYARKKMETLPPSGSSSTSSTGSSGCMIALLVIGGLIVLSLIISSITDNKPQRNRQIARTPIAVVNVPSANLRAGTSTNHRIVGKAARGDTLQILSRVNGWLYIKHKNTRGYIYEKLVNQVRY